MIVNSSEILKKAKQNKMAIPEFVVKNLGWIKVVLEECDQNNSPVIMSFDEETIKNYGGFSIVVSIIKALDNKFNIPIVIQLNDATTFEVCKEAIDNGFTSIMLDLSKLNIEDSIKLTKNVKEYADKYTISLEAKIDNIKISNYTNIETAKEFLSNFELESFIPAIGNTNEFIRPIINIELCNKLNKELEIPLSLQGTFGIDNKTLKELINNGICKVTFDVELQIVWSNAIKKYLINNNMEYNPQKIISSGEIALKNIVRDKINILSSN